MPASYPGTIKTFTTKANVTDVVDASHPNEAEAEIRAIELVLGTNPQTSVYRGLTYVDVKARLEDIESDYALNTHVHDHGVLTGLGDDDHAQYLNTTRHDTAARHTFGGALGNPAAPTTIVSGNTPSIGTGAAPAKDDHRHGFTFTPVWGPVSPMTSYGLPSSDGVASTLAHSDHNHGTPLPDVRGPTGVIVPFGGVASPAGWLLCDGAAVSRTTYADLFGVISTRYGVGDGTTTFNVPNLVGRFPRGIANNVVPATGTTGAHNHGGGGGTTGAGSSHSHSGSSGTTGHTHTQASHDHGYSEIRGDHDHALDAMSTTAPHRHLYSPGTGAEQSTGYQDTTHSHTGRVGSVTGHAHFVAAVTPTINNEAGHTHSVSVGSEAGHTHSMGSFSTDSPILYTDVLYIIKT